MSEFHYVRTPGGDGGVDACEGPAIGLDLDSVLSDGLPPWRIALEIVAALCEILDIAEEDGEIHGEVDPKYVFIDETGAVSLEGFGVKRSRTRAPEGTPKDVRSDLYGLGETALRTISTVRLPEPLPDDDPDRHDDCIIDAALEIDLSHVHDEMQGDIQWFIAKLMSFDREDRPAAVDAWRTFIAFANECDGPDMVDWCAAALDGGGERRQEAAREEREFATAEPTDEEDLGGPLVQQGPLQGNRISFDDGGSGSKGGATAFWTKAEMKKALDREAAAEEEGPPQGIGGGTATNFWSKDQLDAMARGDGLAPRPRRAEGEGQRRRATASQRVPDASLRSPAPRPEQPPTQQLSPPVQQQAVQRAAPSAPPPVQAHQPLPPPSPSPRPSPPQHAPSQAPPPRTPAPAPQAAYPEDEEDEAGGGLKFFLFGGGVAAVGAIAAVLVLVALLVLLVVVSSQNGSATPPPPQPPTAGIDDPAVPGPAPVPVDGVTDGAPDGGTEGGTTGSAPSPAPLPTRPKPTPTPSTPSPSPTSPKPSPTPRASPRPSPSPSPRPSPRASPRPSPTPSPLPLPGGDARVQLRSSGRGSVTGCSPSTVEFDGIRNFVVEGYRLPATCMVTIDGARGVFQVYGAGDLTCDRQGTAVVCDKTQVP